MSVIQLDHVSRWYHNVVAVNDVSMTIGPGVTGLRAPGGPVGPGAALRPQGGLDVEASDFGRFAQILPRLAREHEVRLLEVSPTDESLESVFAYLVAT